MLLWKAFKSCIVVGGDAGVVVNCQSADCVVEGQGSCWGCPLLGGAVPHGQAVRQDLRVYVRLMESCWSHSWRRIGGVRLGSAV